MEKDVFQIDLLIGADYCWMIVEDDIVRGPGPTAVASKLGYLLSGPTNLKNKSVMTTLIYKAIVTDADLEHKLCNYWDLETMGITDNPNSTLKYEHYRDNELRLENGKYTASLPWKTEHAPLPTNYNICNKRT